VAFYQPHSDVYISAPSIHLPSREVTNEQLVAWMGIDMRPEWIARRTGIRTRRWVADDEAVSDIAIAAASRLLDRWPAQRDAIRQVVLATISGDCPIPPTSPLIQERLGLRDAGCFDLGAACAGFATALYTASAFCEATGETQLVVAADIRSKFLDRHDLATAALFGDGAAACLVSRDQSIATFRLVAAELLSDGSVADIVCLPAGGSRLPCHWPREPEQSFIRMKDGPRLFVLAAEGMSTAARSLLGRVGLTIDGVDWVVPHQANLHLVREVGRLLGCPPERIVETVQVYGNTSGSSVGLALHELCGRAGLQDGQNVLLVSAGGGGLAATVLLSKVQSHAA
jgi:3-oxoacyl-[acyl-carrier-protein] synthase III